jgi:TfoX N-terminal domain
VAFDPKLVERVRREIGERRGLSERQMFGCAAFFLNGNLSCGVRDNEIIVRVHPSSSTAAVKEPGARPFDLSGRPMKGWVLVDPTRIEGPKAFSKWISRGVEYASSLPKK